MQPISKGTKFTAEGGLWTVLSVGNGRYSVRCEASKRVYSIPFQDLQSDLESGRAYVANPPCYGSHEESGVAWGNDQRRIQAVMRRAQS